MTRISSSTATLACVGAPALRPGPLVSTTSLAAVAFVVSLMPSLLPRPAAVQALLSGLLVAVAIVASRPLARLEVRLAPGEQPAQLRWLVLAGAILVCLGALMVGDDWLDAQRRTAGLAPAGPGYWPLALGGAALLVGALLSLGRATRRARRWGRTSRGRTGLAVCTVLPLAVGCTVGGAALTAEDSAGPAWALSGPPAVAGAVRVYVGIDEAPTVQQRAALAVRRLVRAGGLERDAVVVAFPTGSGWVNPEAVAGLEESFAGDVAMVAVQAGTAPSWVELALDRDAHEASARALVAAVSARVAALPAQDRPDLHLYGESLGALVGRAAMATPAARLVCSALWVGLPGESGPARDRERLLRNPDDPVPLWSTQTILDRPAGWPEDRAWIPGLSYLTTSLDLVGSRAAKAGHGHVYGAEQTWQLPGCDR